LEWTLQELDELPSQLPPRVLTQSAYHAVHMHGRDVDRQADKPEEGIQGGQGVRALGDRFVDRLKILEP